MKQTTYNTLLGLGMVVVAALAVITLQYNFGPQEEPNIKSAGPPRNILIHETGEGRTDFYLADPESTEERAADTSKEKRETQGPVETETEHFRCLTYTEAREDPRTVCVSKDGSPAVIDSGSGQ